MALPDHIPATDMAAAAVIIKEDLPLISRPGAGHQHEGAGQDRHHDATHPPGGQGGLLLLGGCHHGGSMDTRGARAVGDCGGEEEGRSGRDGGAREDNHHETQQ